MDKDNNKSEHDLEEKQTDSNETEDKQPDIKEAEDHESIEEALDLEVMGEAIEEELVNINTSLATQICEELQAIESEEVEEEEKRKKKQKAIYIQWTVVSVLFVLVASAFFLGFTKPGNNLLIKMGVNVGGAIWDTMTGDFEENPEAGEDIDDLDQDDDFEGQDLEAVESDQILWPDIPGDGRQEDYVINILLLGEEAIDSGTSRGRTDLIMVATMNTKTNELKLTSLMRDMLVRIPGYQENKLNAAYQRGGVPLLYETIALNFDIQLDGCAMVNFENFERIIDNLGGLEITLTSGESRYLNRTNYISKPQYRTTVAGTQTLNGNQVLGYSRVRYRASITGYNDDYGRTDRHRIILNAIFDKYKTNSKIELASMMYSLLPMISTDISGDTFKYMLNTFIDMGTMDIEQLRIPVDGKFRDNVSVRGMDVLIPDYNENIRILHEFIFADEPQ